MLLCTRWMFPSYGVNGLWNMYHYNFHFYPSKWKSNRWVPIWTTTSPRWILSPFLFLFTAEVLNVMMNALVNVCFFFNYQVGRTDIVRISRLQFADDTLLVGNKSWENIRSLNALLLLLEVASGLKVSFHKSMLVDGNVLNSWLNKDSIVMNSKIGHLLFMYLGLPIGGDYRKLNFWKPLVEKVNSRLSGWKSHNLSLGGRLVLLKFFLSYLPV